MDTRLLDHGEKLNRIQHIVEQLAIKQREQKGNANQLNNTRNLIDFGIVIAAFFIIQYIMMFWYGNGSNVKEIW